MPALVLVWTVLLAQWVYSMGWVGIGNVTVRGPHFSIQPITSAWVSLFGPHNSIGCYLVGIARLHGFRFPLSSSSIVYSLHCIQCGCRRNVDWKISVAIFSIFVSTSKRLLFSKVRNPIPLAYGGFIQCITKILESSKSYTCKIYVSNIGAYPCQTSIIV
jgi:hypothetical protein